MTTVAAQYYTHHNTNIVLAVISVLTVGFLIWGFVTDSRWHKEWKRKR